MGPNHYIQVVNVRFQIFDKSGNVIQPATATNSLWSGFGGPCESDNDGDAIFMYDEQADRWVLAQFAVSSGQAVCFAVSTTPDPTGSFYLYQLDTQRFPDYFKLGVWPDSSNNAYFMGTNSGNQNQYDVYAIDRQNLLAGTAPRPAQYFQDFYNLMMPADLDGDNPPPAGSPGIFYTFRDGGESYFNSPPSDSLDIYEFHVDWNTPANSTYTMVQSFTPPTFADFNWTVCGFFQSDCLPQPGTNQKLDSASWWPMQRLQYRNQLSYETLVGAWVVDPDGAGNHSAPRWFELRRSGGSWALQYQGTWDPDAVDRWMPSVALDGSGNMALGYSVVDDGSGSGSAVKPGLRYATRDLDAANFNAEATLIDGTGVETGINRWGDYASMEVDPSDDCTFWFTSEYIASDGSYNWSTRIATFKVPSCTGSICDADPPAGLTAVGNGDNRIDLSWNPVSGATEYRIYRSLTSGGPYTQIATVSTPSPPATSYSDTTVSGGVTYYYVVTTYTTCESTTTSNEASASTTGPCTEPPAFDGLQSVTDPQNATCTLDLAWNPATSICGNGITYTVYRDTSSGFTPSLANELASGIATTTYSDADSLVSGTTYYYVVRAVDSGSGAAESNLVEKSGVPHGPDADGTFSAGAEAGDTMYGTSPWSISSARAHSGSNSYYSGYSNDECAYLRTGELALTAGQASVLSYWTAWDIENRYDGGVVEISTDGGGSWSTLTPSSGYPGSFGNTSDACGYGNNDPCYTGTGNLTFSQYTVDLSAYNGQTVMIRWNFSTDGSVTGEGWYVDDISVTHAQVPGACTTGSGCTNPGAVSIDSITDDDACAQSGVTITFSGGAGATSFELWVDGAQAAAGITSPYAYDPGDTGSHSYVVRAVDGTCYTDSAAQSATDEDDSPGQPVITGIADADGCSQSGIQVSYSAGSGATRHDLVRDGTVVVTGYSSGATYDPGDTASHSYVVRAVNGSCTTDSAAQSASDGVGAVPTFGGITSAADADDCGDTGVTLTWAAPTDWGDNGETAGRGFNIYRDAALVTTVAATATSYTDTGGANNTGYTYKVEAVNGCSLTSDGGATASASDKVSAAPTFGGIVSASDVDACADSGVAITWTAPTDWGDNGVSAANRKFDIYRDTTLVTSVSASTTSYTDTGGANNTSYTYTVEAVNGCGDASDGGASLQASDDVGGAVFAGISSAADISACDASGIRLSWPAVTDWNDGGANADQRQYQVQRSTDGGATWGVIGTGPPNGQSSYTWDDATATAGTSYVYRIVTVNGTGCQNDGGATASAMDAQGAAPTFGGIGSATDVDGCTASGIALSWAAASDWVDGGENGGSRKYEIFRDGTLIGSVGSGTTSYTDSGAPANTSVTYRVAAVNGCASSSDGGASLSATNADSGTPPSFAGLSSVSAAGDGSCSLVLSWSAGSATCGGVAYNVYRDTTSGFTPAAGNRIASGVTATGYTDTGLTGGTTYYYVVRAFDTSNGAEETNTVEGSGTVSGGGSTTQTVFYDDFEGSPTPAGHEWIAGTFSDDGNDGADWSIGTANPYSGTYAGQFGDGSEYVNDADDALIAGCDGSTGNCGTSGMNGIALPAAATSVTLSFWEWRDFENGWDGAMLMYSTTSATSGYTQVPDTDQGSGPYISAISYNGTLGNYCPPSSAPTNADVWTDNIGAWQHVTVNLDRMAGQTIWLLWRATTDCSIPHEGWYIDEVKVEAVVPGGSCTSTAEVSPASSTKPAVLVRDDASSTGYYLYFEPISGATSYNVYEGTHGSYYEHSCLVQGVTTESVTGGTWDGFLRAEITPQAAGSHYYLVTEVTDTAEGPIGFDSNDTARPAPGCP